MKSETKAAMRGSLDAGLVERISSTGAINPRPMKFAQTRFTIVRENDGFLGEVNHAARYSRRSWKESGGIASPSSGVGGRGLFSRGWFMSPEVALKTVTSPGTSPFFNFTRAKRLANL